MADWDRNKQLAWLVEQSNLPIGGRHSNIQDLQDNSELLNQTDDAVVYYFDGYVYIRCWNTLHSSFEREPVGCHSLFNVLEHYPGLLSLKVFDIRGNWQPDIIYHLTEEMIKFCFGMLHLHNFIGKVFGYNSDEYYQAQDIIDGFARKTGMGYIP
ncbi:MAG: hypothetical protein UT24_C0011G0021 [Candidatus Woesebacteria bacterium GW2011_GWB1_39_12]|uniref:Uncharacterized protein n=1 Tax=Candidatus Woesebacteria bacterium GW2011_GWB1_39_12 TaxID=1618574 RepID=A0A0G0MBH4_9BACT|nr:MAG: hypothetical protein UT24_C0011G0021 [Candidatus Woesebacteria bacterium GW2011_GWB1_39_12]